MAISKFKVSQIFDYDLYNNTGYEHIVQKDKFNNVIFTYCFDFTFSFCIFTVLNK